MSGLARSGAAARRPAAALIAPNRRASGADRTLRGLAPELLEAVEVARVGREHVDDDVQVVHEDPAGLGDALLAARQQPMVLLEALPDAVVDGLRLTVRVAGADDEVVRVAEDAAQVELDDVDRLLVSRVVLDQRGEAGGVRLEGARALAHADTSPRPLAPA